jgi:hypothetical protein
MTKHAIFDRVNYFYQPPKFAEHGCRTYPFKAMMKAVSTKGHNSYFIYGKKGAGKSTYALLCGFSVYQNWEDTLYYTCFTRDEILERIGECFDAEGKVIKRIPLLIWDDATFENLKSRSYDPFIDEFTKFYTVIRSVVANFMWTGPSFRSLPAKLRDLDWNIIYIIRETDGATANFFDWNSAPKGDFFRPKVVGSEQRIRETYKFSWIPQDVRAEYEKQRDSYSYIGYKQSLEALKQGRYMKQIEKQIVRAIDNKIKRIKPKNKIKNIVIPEKPNK